MSAPRIVIVGGVAGGASAATRARRMNEAAKITVFEKGEQVSFANCGLPYHIGGQIKERGKLLLATAQSFRQSFNINVRTRHEVLSIDRAAKAVEVVNLATGERFREPYDTLILSPGAAPIVPPWSGVGASNVFTLRDMADMDRIKGFVEALIAGDPPLPPLVKGGNHAGDATAAQASSQPPIAKDGSGAGENAGAENPPGPPLDKGGNADGSSGEAEAKSATEGLP